jgi:hypothetical protein
MWGALRRGNQGGHVTALTRHLQGVELGGRAAGFGGGVVRLRQFGRRAMTSGAHLTARCGGGQRRFEAGALSCDGSGNRAGRRRSTRAR